MARAKACFRGLLALVFTAILLAPSARAKQNDKPDLKITASIDTAAPEQQPILVVHIINQAGHTLRIPEPPLLCKPAPGALSLQVKFTPDGGNHQAQRSQECDLEVDGSGLPDIRERAKNWIVLKSGQDYLARRPIAMGLNTDVRGTYDIWVVYDGPAANEDDIQKMKDAQIAVPIGKFESDKITYKISGPKD